MSLHGTGGAWLVAGVGADSERFAAGVTNSLDRKVCNTLNVCCIPAQRADELVPRFLVAADAAAAALGTSARFHIDAGAEPYVPADRFTTKVTIRRADGERIEPWATLLERDELGTEWEWEGSPEVALVVTESVAEAVALHNSHSPRFIASLVSDDHDEQERFYADVDAPVRRRRVHPLGRRPVRPRHAGAGALQLAVRSAPRTGRGALGRLDPHHPPPRHDQRPDDPPLISAAPRTSSRAGPQRRSNPSTSFDHARPLTVASGRDEASARRHGWPRRRRGGLPASAAAPVPSAAIGARPTATGSVRCRARG